MGEKEARFKEMKGGKEQRVERQEGCQRQGVLVAVERRTWGRKTCRAGQSRPFKSQMWNKRS